MKNKVILMAPSAAPYGGGISNWTKKILQIGAGDKWGFLLVDEKPAKRKNYNKRSLFDFLKEIPRTLRIYSDLRKSLRNPNAKIVHIAIPSYYLSMAREYFSVKIAMRKRKKVVLHFRSTLPNTVKSKRAIRIFHKLINIVDYIIVLNKESLNFLSNYSKTPAKIIPNFIDQEVLKKPQVVINRFVRRMIYTGMIIEEKGCFLIIELAKKFPDIEFVLMGKKGAEFIDIENTENLVFIDAGTNKEVIRELVKSDVFLFPTFFSGEGFSNSLLEAMAVGLPCIVTDWAANSEMIQNKGGIIIETNSLDALIEATHEIVNSYNKRKEYSDWNRKKVKEFSDFNVISKYVEIYDELIQSRQQEK